MGLGFFISLCIPSSARDLPGIYSSSRVLSGWISAASTEFEGTDEIFSNTPVPCASSSALAVPVQVLDVGCGIGGPYRNIARFTGWDVTGITLNEYQAPRRHDPSLRRPQPSVSFVARRLSRASAGCPRRALAPARPLTRRAGGAGRGRWRGATSCAASRSWTIVAAPCRCGPRPRPLRVAPRGASPQRPCRSRGGGRRTL